MNEKEASREGLEKKIAGDIVLSESPGAAIQKWRAIFKISQRTLADKMHVMSSVISDYESGRRKSPGVAMIKKIVDAIITIDEETGGPVSHEFNNIYSGEKLSDAIIDIRELKKPTTIKEIVTLVSGNAVIEGADMSKKIYGYAIIDSIKAIVEISPSEFVRLYGITTDRAIIFTGVAHGKSPLVAIKVANLKPGVVVFHGLKELDKVAERIAHVEKIPVIISNKQTVEELVSSLKTLE